MAKQLNLGIKVYKAEKELTWGDADALYNAWQEALNNNLPYELLHECSVMNRVEKCNGMYWSKEVLENRTK